MSRFIPGCHCCGKICFLVIICAQDDYGKPIPIPNATITIKKHGTNIVLYSGVTDAKGQWCFSPGTNLITYDYALTLPSLWFCDRPTGSVTSGRGTQTVTLNCRPSRSNPKFCCGGYLLPKSLNLFDEDHNFSISIVSSYWQSSYVIPAEGRTNNCIDEGAITLTVEVQLFCGTRGKPFNLDFTWAVCGAHNADDSTPINFLTGQTGSGAGGIPTSIDPFFLQITLPYPARPGVSVGGTPEVAPRTITITG